MQAGYYFAIREHFRYIVMLYLRVLTVTTQPRKIVESMVYKVQILFSVHCPVVCPVSLGDSIKLVVD